MYFFRIFFCLQISILLSIPSAFACGACQNYLGFEGKRDGKESISSGAMLNSPTASTLGRNHFSGGYTFQYLRYNTIPPDIAHELHEEGRDVHDKIHEEFYDLYLGYGILSDLDIFLSAPIVYRKSLQIDEEEALGQHERSSGFGDMRLVGKFRFWKKYIEAALIAGIKFPTGETSDKDKLGNKFETELQPGSGSWDGEFGIALSRSFKRRFSFATSFKYDLKTRGAQDFKFGDVFRYNVGASAAFRKLGKYPNLTAVLELNNEWDLKDHARDIGSVFDSGGTTIFVTPGLSADITKNISAFWAMPVPIYQDLGGVHQKLKFEVLAGINFYF